MKGLKFFLDEMIF